HHGHAHGPFREAKQSRRSHRDWGSPFLQTAYGAEVGRAITSIDAALTLEDVCHVLEGGLDRPVINETHLTDSYAVHTEAKSNSEFLHALCDKLGVIVSPQRRQVSILVVEEREPLRT